MTFAELKNIRQDNNKNCSRSKLSRVLCNIVSHDLARKIIFSLPVRNCTIFAQACVEDLIFLLKWLMLIFNFCVSTVSVVERMINKTKPSFMQICVYVACKMFISTMFGDLLAIVIIRSKLIN